MDRTIILASASMGRRGVLDNMKIPYIPIPADIDETIPWLNPPEEIRLLAIKKAQASHLQNRDREEKWIVAADTLVVLNSKPIGKPHSLAEANFFLHNLSGKEHQVITGIAFMNRITGEVFSDYDITTVSMGLLSEDEISSYLETGEWQGAAGGYRIQKQGAALVNKINGSFTNVIGLPIRKLLCIMKKSGYPV